MRERLDASAGPVPLKQLSRLTAVSGIEERETDKDKTSPENEHKHNTAQQRRGLHIRKHRRPYNCPKSTAAHK